MWPIFRRNKTSHNSPQTPSSARLTWSLAGLLLCALAIVVGFFAYDIVKTQRNHTATLRTLMNQTEANTDALEEISRTANSLDRVQEQLTETISTLKEARGQTQDTLSSIRTSIEERRESEQAQDITHVTKQWSSRIARIDCDFEGENGRDSSSRGSGVALSIGNTLHVMTNKHLVEEDDAELDECSVDMPQHDRDDAEVDASDVIISDGRDIAYLSVADASNPPAFDQSQNACVAEPERGDRVVILGFPKVGAEESITVTEGIISGLEDDFYITSAKIERGNSGGAAILTKHNCLVGIPVLAVVGRIESLARILPVSSLERMDL